MVCDNCNELEWDGTWIKKDMTWKWICHRCIGEFLD